MPFWWNRRTAMISIVPPLGLDPAAVVELIHLFENKKH